MTDVTETEDGAGTVIGTVGISGIRATSASHETTETIVGSTSVVIDGKAIDVLIFGRIVTENSHRSRPESHRPSPSPLLSASNHDQPCPKSLPRPTRFTTASRAMAL